MAQIVVYAGVVVIRIDSLNEGASLVWRIAGSLSGPDVAVLEDSVVREGLPKRIELSEVDFVDGEGARALLGLEARGVALAGVEPFVEILLRAPPGNPSE